MAWIPTKQDWGLQFVLDYDMNRIEEDIQYLYNEERNINAKVDTSYTTIGSHEQFINSRAQSANNTSASANNVSLVAVPNLNAALFSSMKRMFFTEITISSGAWSSSTLSPYSRRFDVSAPGVTTNSSVTMVTDSSLFLSNPMYFFAEAISSVVRIYSLRPVTVTCSIIATLG